MIPPPPTEGTMRALPCAARQQLQSRCLWLHAGNYSNGSNRRSSKLARVVQRSYRWRAVVRGVASMQWPPTGTLPSSGCSRGRSAGYRVNSSVRLSFVCYSSTRGSGGSGGSDGGDRNNSDRRRFTIHSENALRCSWQARASWPCTSPLSNHSGIVSVAYTGMVAAAAHCTAAGRDV